MLGIRLKTFLIASFLLPGLPSGMAQETSYRETSSHPSDFSVWEIRGFESYSFNQLSSSQLINTYRHISQRGNDLFSGLDPLYSQSYAALSKADTDKRKDSFRKTIAKKNLPLTIEEVEKLVEKNNPSLQALSLQVEQAKSKLLAAISSWYPTIDLTANGLPQYLVGDQYSNPDYSANPETRSSQWKTAFSAKVKWNLIDPARAPQIASARDNLEKSRESYQIKLRDLRLEALIRFFELQRADRGVTISQKSRQVSRISLDDAKIKFKAGVASKFEVLEAETQLSRDQRNLNKSLRDQMIAQNALSVLLELPPNVVPVSSSRLRAIGKWKTSLEESITSAYTYREELDRLILDISINNSKANEALAAIQPVFSLENTFSTSRTQGQLRVVEPIEKDYSYEASNTIGITASWRVFDGGNARALYRFNKQKAKEVEYSMVSERGKIRQEVEESYLNLRAATQDIMTTKREVLSQREVLRLSRLRYKAGVSNQREVVNSQRDLTLAEVNYADAISSYNISLAQLRRRTGLDAIKACGALGVSEIGLDRESRVDSHMEDLSIGSPCHDSVI